MPKKYTLRTGKSDEHRLDVMNEACNLPSIRFLADAGVLKQGAKVLEVGCGMGQMSALIAACILPKGTLDAVDNSQEQLDLAEKHLKKKKIKNVNPIKLSALEVGDKLKKKYDLIYNRFLLEHMDNPAEALKIFKKCLAPGGAVVSEVSDMTTLFCSPPSNIFNTWLKCQSPPILQFNVKCGYDIHMRYYEAGFKNLMIRINQSLLQTPYEKSYLSYVFEQYKDKMTGPGKTFASSKESDEFSRKLNALIKDKRFIASFPRTTQVCGRLN